MKNIQPLSLSLLQQQIAALPFDVLIRRIHSSSQKNKSRSLEAHFLGQRPHENNDGKGVPFHLRDTTSYNCAKKVEKVTKTKTEAKAKVSSALVSSSELREVLSQRLLLDVQQSRSRLRLNLDDLSLILANAIRHGFSFELTNTTLALFIEALNNAKGVENFSRQVEALSRVMEVCCDELDRCNTITWDSVANLVVTVEQRWSLFTKSNSLCCLLIQFFAIVIAAELPVPSSSSSSVLKTDPLLLKERCLQFINDATDILVNTLETGVTLSWNASELQGMCRVVGQLNRFEETRNLYQTGFYGRKRFWKRSPVPLLPVTRTKTTATAVAAAAAAGVPIGGGTIKPEKLPVHKKVSQMVSSQILVQNKLVRKVQVMTLQEVSDVFFSVSTACGTEAVDRFAVPVHNLLKRTIVGDAESMAHVIRIGETSLQVEGATLVLVEVIRCISRYAFILTSGAMWNLLLSACVLLENSPLSISDEVVQCLKSLQFSVEDGVKNLPTPVSTDFFSFRLGVCMLGTLLVRNNIKAGQRLEEIIYSTLEAAPPLKDGKRGAATTVRCFFFLASKFHSFEQEKVKEQQQGTECDRWTRALHLAMMEAARLVEKKTEPTQYHLTSKERTMLRMAFKQVQGIKQQKDTAAPLSPSTPSPPPLKTSSETSTSQRRQQQPLRKEIGQI
ncbi:hypothetical protein LSM04_004586 [Trypanosoma melophagium]|uniref:uncharacterized protein n=1 Tax=Trypanosoma melophagium TaxID=715481 RepID=UPI00351A150E|nr:hypothetical protein LSM04_004586 [Trypanosoma melophagium]